MHLVGWFIWMNEKFKYLEKYLSQQEWTMANPTRNGLDGNEISGFLMCVNFINFVVIAHEYS